MFLRKWRLKIWQHCRKLLTRSSKKLYEPIIFCKQTISLQRWLWKHRIKFHIPAKKISTKNRKKIMNLFVFSNKKVLQQCSSGKLKCSFDNRLAKFSPEACQKFWKWSFFSKNFLLQCSSGKVECSFDNSAENFSTEARRKLMKLQLFQTEVFTKNVLLNLSTAVMTTRPKKFQPKSEEHSWCVKTFLTKIFSQKFLLER